MSLNQATNLERARLAWGADLPEWVKLLAAACDRTNQRAVADRLGWKSPTISKLINRKYPASYDEAETRVRAAFGSEDVDCPVMGAIPLAGCVRNRRRKALPTNHLHQLWARHCPDCPLNTDIPED